MFDSWTSEFYRLLYYTALALAGMCLTCAEQPFLPDLWMGLLVFLGLLVLSWWGHDRWRLPLWASNVLGLLIGIITVFWLWIHLPSKTPSWAVDVPVSAMLVPYLGPVTMALMLVRIFRSSQNDFWVVQGMGLLQVALGCVLATGPLFGALFMAYLATAMASLWGYHLSQCRTSSWRRMIVGGGFWSLVVTGLAVPCYLFMPRGDGQEWDPFLRFGVRKGATVSQTGHSGEIDLHRVGEVELDESPAFTVQATGPGGEPKIDLPRDQRWRGPVLDIYESGRWATLLRVPGGMGALRALSESTEGPPNAYHLTFTVQPRRSGGLFLAEPVPFGSHRWMLPVRNLEPANHREPALFSENSGTILPLTYLPQTEYRYRQAVDPAHPRDRYANQRTRDNYLADLVSDRTPGLAEWTHALIRQLADLPKYRHLNLVLPELPEVQGRLRLPEPYREAVALMLTDHLKHSGEYTYTLSLSRHDEQIDPILDFLQNTKRGHCERYASALALMLRSQGIPTRVVKGFRGAEHEGSGKYLIRQSYAHAWVETLVPRGEPLEGQFDWLILDPTPELEAPAEPSFSLIRLFQQSQKSGEDLWRELVMEYNSRTQAAIYSQVTAIWDNWNTWTLMFLVGANLICGILLYRQARAPHRVGPAGLYRRLIVLLGRMGQGRGKLNQTPQERAQMAALVLAEFPPAAVHADLPARIVGLFYRSRFGGQPSELAEEQELSRQLDALAQALPRNARSRARA